jgi:hypothetical protein
MTRAPSKPEPDGGPAEAVEEIDDDGREFATFTFQGRDDIELYEPTTGQRFILMQTLSIADEGSDTAEKVELALGFSTMLRALFRRPEQRTFVTGALARGHAELEDYFDLAKQMAEAWEIEEPAPQTGPRRAAPRKPAARPVNRKR